MLFKESLVNHSFGSRQEIDCCQLNSPVIGNGWKNGRLLARVEDGWAVRYYAI
jgi:hypothetical protein